MHQRLRRFGPWVLVGLASLLFMGCTQILNLIEGATSSTNTTTTPPVVAADSIRVVISELQANLITGNIGVTSAQAAILAKSAQDNVTASKVSETDFEKAFPVALAGAEIGLASPEGNFTDGVRIKAVGLITKSFMASLNGRFDATSRSFQNSRALTLSAQVVTNLLARLSKAAVTNLVNTGIAPASLGQTAGDVVGNMITGLASGGVNKALVSEALVQITQNAVSSLKDAGVGDTAMAVAVQAVTKGAVSAVATIKVDGVTTADFPAMTKQITAGAAASLESVVSSTVDMKTLVASVATGSTEGIAVAVKTVSLDATQVSISGSDILKAMVQNATEGATEGVMKNLSVNVSADAAGLIGAVTSAASMQLAINAKDMALSSADIQTSVATGASSAAQTALSGALTTADLQAAIVFKDDKGVVTQLDAAAQAALSTAINTGIAQASNAAPVAVFLDMAVVVNHLATLDGTGSSDDKDTVDQLKFLWTLLQKPKASGAKLNATTLSKVTFTPDVAGTYLVSLKVTDTKGADSIEVYGVVTATADNSNVVYNGKSAPDRLANAKALMKTGDLPEARDELLTILGHYPDGPLFDEVIVWLGQAYDGLGNGDLAGLRFKEAITRTTPLTAANQTVGVKARLIWADSLNSKALSDSATLSAATAVLQDVIANRAGTTDEGEARRLGANLLSNTGKQAEAVTAYLAVLALPSSVLAPESRYWASLNLGFSYSAQKLWSQAYTALLATHANVAVGPDSRWPLSLLKYCDAMWPWWFTGDAQNDPASGFTQANQGIKAIEAGVADTSIDASDRMEMAKVAAEFYIWGKGNSAESKLKAVNLLADLLATTATATNTTTNGKRVWALLRLGQAYQNLRDTALTDTERTSLTTKATDTFTQAQTLGWGKWYGWRPAGEAMVEAAGNWHWNSSDPQKDVKAQTLLTTVISGYPAGADSYPKAFAYFRQGELLRDIGNDLRNQTGKDYQTPLQNAIVSFSKVTPSYFSDLDPNTWFFTNAQQNIGDCYTSLKQFTLAVNYFVTSLKDPNLSPNSKVWAQLSLANCYSEQVMLLLQEGNADAAQALWDAKALPAYGEVAKYKEADGKPINRGEPAAHALLQQGNYLRNAAGTTRWNLNMASTVWIPLYEQAIAKFQLLIPGAFPDLPSDGWEFIEAANNQADCQFNLGVYDQGRAALQAILTAMDNQTVKDKQRWGVKKHLVSSYREEAQNVGNDMNQYDRATSAVMNLRLGKEREYLNQAQALFAEWQTKGQANQDAANITAWVLTDAAWAYLDMFDVMGWDSLTMADGSNGYTAADWVEIGKLQTELDALKGQITDNAALKDANSGRSLARLHRILGHWNENWANRLPNGSAWVDREGRYATAITYYDQVLANAASDPDDYGAALSSKASVKGQYARNAPVLADRKKAFEEAIALMDDAIVNPRVFINQVAWSAITVAQLYRDLHSSYYKDSSQLGGLGLPDMDGPGAWQTVVALLMQPIVDHVGNYGKLNDGGAYNEAKRLLADAQNAKITVQVW